MPFPIIPILAAIPSILSAFKTVKDLNDDIEGTIKKAGVPVSKKLDIKSLKGNELNSFKRDIAINILREFLLDKIKKRGGDEDDIGTLVDFACFIYKMVLGKKKK